jgi:hypothetical protein
MSWISSHSRTRHGLVLNLSEIFGETADIGENHARPAMRLRISSLSTKPLP